MRHARAAAHVEGGRAAARAARAWRSFNFVEWKNQGKRPDDTPKPSKTTQKHAWRSAKHRFTFGFWKNNTGKSVDYEIRIYPNHKSASEYGLPYVDEVIGDDAILKKSSSSWSEGIQDRRTRRDKSYGGSSANTVRAKYLHYLVYNNTIILCSGLDLSYAIQNCTELVLALEEQ